VNILLVDNHDSFTYNLAELLRGHGKVTFNIVTADRLHSGEAGLYDKILFSPGPGIPEEHPKMFEILERYGSTKPILGICLGMQAMAIHFGGKLMNLPEVIHGQPRKVNVCQPQHYLFEGVPEQFFAGLYHSWAVDKDSLPGCLTMLAQTENEIPMALSHNIFDLCGVQFHPESIITEHGQQIINNWIEHEDDTA
jgi:anthranilate synthase component 2